jgi:hypothetical protein
MLVRLLDYNAHGQPTKAVAIAGPGDAIPAALGRQRAQREAQLLRDAQREVRRGRSH